MAGIVSEQDINKMDVSNKGVTVHEHQAKTFVTLVEEKGLTPSEAAEEVGITLRELRNTGAVVATIKKLLDRADMADSLRKRVGKARLVELALQDEDLKVAVSAAKVISGESTPQTNVTVGPNLIVDPDVLASLKSLGIPPPKGEEDETIIEAEETN
jgi:hypothetical protein